ncbi:MAG: FkbM family methyltransferase [Parvibaculum sp.]
MTQVSARSNGPDLTFRQRLTWLAHLYKAVAYQYHRDLGRGVQPLIGRDAVIIDVGAHAGQHTKLFARMVPEGHVYAFEPGVYARSILEIVFRLRRFANLTLVPLGLSDAVTTETLHVPLKRRGSMGFGLSHMGPQTDGRETASEDIQLTTLDQFVKDNALSRIDFIKVDIEGWEVHFLRGAMASIERFRPAIMLEVIEPILARAGATPAEIFDALLPHDYVVFATSEHDAYRMNPVDGFTGAADYMFVPKERAHLVKVG